MKLKYVTCSGLNEKNDMEMVAGMACFNRCIEIAFQVSGTKCSFGSPRYEWLTELHRFCLKFPWQRFHFALHLNSDWVERFCAGEEVPELEKLLKFRDAKGRRFFGRIQLNFKIGRNKVPPVEKLAEVLKKYTVPGRKFIVSYNESNAEYLQELYKLFQNVDVIYDNSFGEGVKAEWKPPCFGDHRKVVQGYAGGLSPENVYHELEKIMAILPKDAVFSIDAENGIKDEPGKEKYCSRCASYIGRAFCALPYDVCKR